MEHSERGREVTEQVAMWIVNDGDHYFAAQELARYGGSDALARHLEIVLQNARVPSAPWQVAQDLSARDYDRIDWSSVADDLWAE